MIRILWKISIRNILKHRYFSSVNVFGLALGFTAFVLIALFFKYELSWNKSNINYDRICRVQRNFTNTIYSMDGNDISPHTRAITAQLLEKQFPEFEKVTVIHENDEKFLSAIHVRQISDDKGISADSCFFDVFTYRFIEGEQTGALDDPFSIVLSKSVADKLFAGERALGEIVTVDKKFAMKVTGVYADPAENSSLRPTYIVSFSSLAKMEGFNRSDLWSGDCMTFALLKPGVNIKNLNDKIKTLFSGFKSIENEQLHLCQMKDLYLSFNGRNDYKRALSLLGLTGIFILIMSSFNYINLTLAGSFARGKEVALKKVCGSNRVTLVIQFMGETTIIALGAMVMALTLARIMLPVYSDIVNKHIDISLLNDLKFVFLTILVSIAVGVLSGVYPALFLSSSKIISLIKNEIPGKGREKFNLKRVLVTFQFAISLFLIILTLSISLQVKYLMRKDLGFNKEDLVFARMSVSKQGTAFSQLRARILLHPEIKDASMSRNLPFVNLGGGMTNWEGGGQNEKINCRFNEVSYDFIKNLGIKLTSGRDFSREFPGDAGKSCLINETAARCFGWDNPIGKRLNNNRLTVVGVVNDYIYKNMHNGIEPAILELATDDIYGDWIFAFRVDPANTLRAKDILARELEDVFPNDPFELRDLPVAFSNEASFKTYFSVTRTILFFTVFNIFLAMMGLLGLVSFTVTRRAKEIGVRKINGSTALNIFYLLSREYLILLAIAILVAFPCGYIIYQKLPGAFKLPVQPWIFVLSAGILLTVILLTTSIQTIKAAIKNPVEALRYE